ncbi:hypothetical protein [Lewinella sp. 4G2]|uniref:hypothetical protein n=1 Tax=Lewinella sp. 4G2 TaxID=1803372 RepID=UPI0007B46D14|nr:hypothetical protein [Lewinella sp. 4G2]OAV44352.1 hypothetical protein A3850_007520 [Lewinella sp. 4G2]
MPKPTHDCKFQNVADPRLKDWFCDVLHQYPALAGRTVYLRQLNMKRSTMRAQPVLNRKFFRRATREYRVDFSSHLKVTQHVKIHKVPKEVVVGWFAHELGHVVDYLHRPALGMVSFGLGYALWSRYMRAAERRADQIAVNHGFGQEIIATKNYLMGHSTLPPHYKKRLEKYYLSADEIEGLIAAWEDDQEMPAVVELNEDEGIVTADK